MQVSGGEEELRSFLEAINQSELRALIRKATECKLDHPVVANGFEIRHE
jgi:hypothetical protein